MGLEEMDMIVHGGGIKKVFIANRRLWLKEKSGVKNDLRFQALLPNGNNIYQNRRMKEKPAWRLEHPMPVQQAARN